MEATGNNCQLKELEATSSNSNFSCRLPRDTQNKTDADIGLLVACKVQLSSEVIRWKTESLRLQKERDSAVQKYRALDQAVSKLSEQIKELENRLLHAEEENRLLKLKGSSLREGGLANTLQITQNTEKYHSFPWSCNVEKGMTSCFTRLESTSRYDKQGSPQEDWREVSQKMLQQMRQEMKELQEISSNIMLKEDVAAESEDYTSDLEECVSSLLSETESLKHHLLEQRWKLNSLVEEFDFGKIEICESVRTPTSPPKQHHRGETQSEENYKQYFSKKLGSPCDWNKMAKKMKHILKAPELNVKTCDAEIKSPARVLNVQPSHLSVLEQEKLDDMEKICPVCHMTFSYNVNQMEFEKHVMDHLYSESASLLDQYVIL